MRMERASRWQRRLERGLLAVSIVCLGFCAAAVLGGRMIRVLADNEIARASQVAVGLPGESPRAIVTEHGFVGRIEAPRLGLDAVILEGDGSSSLFFGVGHLPGSALPGEKGNVVLAGHRDTYFRALKDAAPGDAIRITTAGAVFLYDVVSTMVVTPDQVALMADTGEPLLTMITCYPFNYVGTAPRRFVVRARPAIPDADIQSRHESNS